MSGSTLILLLTMIGQCQPGGACPAFSPSPRGVVKQWLPTNSPLDGRAITVYGWYQDGQVTVDPREYPAFVPRPVPAPAPRPSPVPIAPPGSPLPPIASAGLPPVAKPWQMPTGVVAEKLPHIPTGTAWYGGNLPRGDDDEDTTHRTPAPGRAEVFLTVIGDKRTRTELVRNLNADPDFKLLAASMGDRLAVNAYAADNPIVANVGLPAGGKPDVIIQDATGKELARHSNDPGPSVLVSEVRKADPSYRPGTGKGKGLGEEFPDWAVLVGGAAVVAIIIGFANQTSKDTRP